MSLKQFDKRNSKIPGVKSTEQENDQSHDALCVPPLDVSRGCSRDSRSWWWSWTGGLDQTQQTGVTLSVCGRKHRKQRKQLTKWQLVIITATGTWGWGDTFLYTPFQKSVILVQVRNKRQLCCDSDSSDLLGLLVMADQVTYMVYREMTEAWSRPELGWASCGDGIPKINHCAGRTKLSSLLK